MSRHKSLVSPGAEDKPAPLLIKCDFCGGEYPLGDMYEVFKKRGRLIAAAMPEKVLTSPGELMVLPAFVACRGCAKDRRLIWQDS